MHLPRVVFLYVFGLAACQDAIDAPALSKKGESANSVGEANDASKPVLPTANPSPKSTTAMPGDELSPAPTQPAPEVIPTPQPTAPNSTPLPVPSPLPGPNVTQRIAGGYYPNWTEAPPRIRDLEPTINLVYLFAAKPVGGAPGSTGAVTWTAPGNGKGAATNLKSDIQFARSVQKRKIILAVGGAGAGMNFPNRQKSQVFLQSISKIYDDLGGIDGMDWNTFEADQAPDTGEMIWISLELKKRYPGFIISAPPAPWNPKDKEFCAAMVKAGALDYAAPQYYDGNELATIAYMEKNIDEWVALLGAKHVAVGFGIWNQKNYMNIADATTLWKKVIAKHPDLVGAFDWSLALDEGQGWPYSKKLAPLLNP